MTSPFEFGSQPSNPKPDPPLTPAEQSRIRRMISNRESARRSRMRRQRHLDNLRCHLSRLRAMNRELANRVGLLLNQSMLVRSDNDLLRSESNILRDRLSEIRRILMVRQLQRLAFPAPVSACSGFGSGNDRILASLMA